MGLASLEDCLQRAVWSSFLSRTRTLALHGQVTTHVQCIKEGFPSDGLGGRDDARHDGLGGRDDVHHEGAGSLDDVRHEGAGGLDDVRHEGAESLDEISLNASVRSVAAMENLSPYEANVKVLNVTFGRAD